MTWLTWRQHRGELLGAMILLALLGVLLVLHGVPMHEAYERDGVRACQTLMFGPGGFDQGCQTTVAAFDDAYGALPRQATSWLPFLPMVAGMLIGAGLVAREFEQGTWQLAWTQGVTRTRWVATKLVLVFGGGLVASVLFAAGMAWWIEPLSPGVFTVAKFNHAVPVFTGYVLVAIAIGVLAGVLVRRTIVAAAITIPGYLAVRLPVEFLLRPRYREPVLTDDPAQAGQGWIIHDAPSVTGSAGGPGPDSTGVFEYHPADRFWEFQLIETAILLGITVALLLITWRLVLGRKAPSSAAESKQDPALV